MERDNTVCWFYPIEKWWDFIKHHFIILMQIQVQLQKVTFFIIKCFLWSRKLKLNCRRLCLTGKKSLYYWYLYMQAPTLSFLSFFFFDTDWKYQLQNRFFVSRRCHQCKKNILNCRCMNKNKRLGGF